MNISMRNLYYSILIYLLRTYSILKFVIGIIEQKILRQLKADGRSYRWDEISGRLRCIPYTGQGLPVLSLSTSLLHWKQ